MALVFNLLERFDKCTHLKIYIDDPRLKLKYTELAYKHNLQIQTDDYPDTGFDLVVPEDYTCFTELVTKINFGIKCSSKTILQGGKTHPSGFYMYPRSSLSKTQLRLANNVGVIDSGYRGNLIGAFDCISKRDEYKVLKYDRLVQICSPTLSPIVVEIVDDESQLGEKTNRADGGFGSTGR